MSLIPKKFPWNVIYKFCFTVLILFFTDSSYVGPPLLVSPYHHFLWDPSFLTHFHLMSLRFSFHSILFQALYNLLFISNSFVFFFSEFDQHCIFLSACLFLNFWIPACFACLIIFNLEYCSTLYYFTLWLFSRGIFLGGVAWG